MHFVRSRLLRWMEKNSSSSEGFISIIIYVGMYDELVYFCTYAHLNMVYTGVLF